MFGNCHRSVTFSFDLTRPSLSPFKECPIHDPMLPSPLSAIAKPVGREEPLQRLRQRLCVGDDGAMAAVNGIPGVGKTTLTVELAHDSVVQAHF
jgi:hypothetical protein